MASPLIRLLFTSYSKATANQFRLLIHTAAYWLMHGLREAAPEGSAWRSAQFDTIRLGLIKVAARVTEMVTRIKVSLPTRADTDQVAYPAAFGRDARAPRGDPT